MLWYRLKWSLSRDGWLTSRQCDSVAVNQWSHGLLSTAVRRRYLSNDSTRRQLHALLASYWLGSSDDDEHGNTAVNLTTVCGSSATSRDSKPVIYDTDQPLTFHCELASGKPRYFR